MRRLRRMLSKTGAWARSQDRRHEPFTTAGRNAGVHVHGQDLTYWALEAFIVLHMAWLFGHSADLECEASVKTESTKEVSFCSDSMSLIHDICRTFGEHPHRLLSKGLQAETDCWLRAQ